MDTTPTEPCVRGHIEPVPADWLVGVSIDEIYGFYLAACDRHLADVATEVLLRIGDSENGRLELQATRYLS